MKSPLTSLCLVAAMLMAMSCDQETPPGQYVLAVNESATPFRDFTITVKAVNDSRCPSRANPNVVCVRGGEAYVVVDVTTSRNSVRDTLCIGPDCAAFIKKGAKATYQSLNRSTVVELIDIGPNATTDKSGAILKIE